MPPRVYYSQFQLSPATRSLPEHSTRSSDTPIPSGESEMPPPTRPSVAILDRVSEGRTPFSGWGSPTPQPLLNRRWQSNTTGPSIERSPTPNRGSGHLNERQKTILAQMFLQHKDLRKNHQGNSEYYEAIEQSFLIGTGRELKSASTLFPRHEKQWRKDHREDTETGRENYKDYDQVMWEWYQFRDKEDYDAKAIADGREAIKLASQQTATARDNMMLPQSLKKRAPPPTRHPSTDDVIDVTSDEESSE